MRKVSVLVLLVAISASGAPKKRPAPIAPHDVPHAIALFLGTLSNDGARAVTFKATAMGTRFFFEESSGVTVYHFVDGRYVKEEFLSGFTLAKALKKYPSERQAAAAGPHS